MNKKKMMKTVLMVLSAWFGLLLFANNISTQVPMGTLCQINMLAYITVGLMLGFQISVSVSHMAINY